MDKSPTIKRTCLACRVEKPLSAFLQISGVAGTNYGSICSACRGSTISHIVLPSDDADTTGSGSGVRIGAKQKSYNVLPDEIVVYVHLYNTQGTSLSSWQSLLNPKLLYEYSVNRPIYSEKAHIDALVRSRANKLHHGYLAIVIKKTDLLPLPKDPPKDVIGHPLVKIREGSLHSNRLLNFTHNELEYKVDNEGVILKNQGI